MFTCGLCVCVCVIRLLLWSTCQQSCMMLRRCLMPSSSGKLTHKHSHSYIYIYTHTHAHTHKHTRRPLWSYSGTLIERIYGSSDQVFLLALFSDPHPSAPSPTHPPCWSSLNFSFIVKISSNWHIQKDTHSNTLMQLLRVPLSEPTISEKPRQTKTHLNLFS